MSHANSINNNNNDPAVHSAQGVVDLADTTGQDQTLDSTQSQQARLTTTPPPSNHVKKIFARLVPPSNAPPISYVLENSGSVARDHLANERTWLAYVRTSLTVAGVGVALVQLFTIAPSTNEAPSQKRSMSVFARPFGATIVLVAIGVLATGVYRYFSIQKAMVQGVYPVARSTVIIITTVLAALASVIFGFLIGSK